MVSHNDMKLLPPDLGACSSLILLELTRNSLKTVPTSLSKLPYLTQLNLVLNKPLNDEMRRCYEQKGIKRFLEQLESPNWVALYKKDCLERVQLFAQSLNCSVPDAESYFARRQNEEEAAAQRKAELQQMQEEIDREQGHTIEQGEKPREDTGVVDEVAE